MSVVLGAECPHCRHQVAAEFMAEWITPIDGINMWTVAFKCVRCQFGIFAVAQPHHGRLRPSEGNGDIGITPAFRVMETYPMASKPPPPFLPDNIVKYYSQAVEAEIREMWDACGGMCRKVIDAATVDMGANKSKKLQQRIDELTDRHLLTSQLKEWADAIRLDGNDAAHDPDPFSPEEAHQIRSFTELFLMYVYTLPGMLNERKAKSAPPTP